MNVSGRFRHMLIAVTCLAICLMLPGCASGHNPIHSEKSDNENIKQSGGIPGTKSYAVLGKRYYPLKSADKFVQEGIASWYGKDFHGKKTANGECYNMHALTAAHKTLPMHTNVLVTCLKTGKSVVVRINDRGPFINGRIIDLSYAAAIRIGITQKGIGRVRIKALP